MGTSQAIKNCLILLRYTSIFKKLFGAGRAISHFGAIQGKLSTIFFDSIYRFFMRLFLSLLFAVLVLFQYDFWFGKNGYWDYKNTTKEIAVHQQENEKLSQRNQIIAAEIKDLKEGVDAIEERARLQHEMVKPNETFYHIVKEHK